MSRQFTKIALLAITAAVAIGASLASAEEWGNLKGKFIFDGPTPTPVALTIDKDPQYCGDKGLVNEDLVVDPKGGAMANVMLWVKKKDVSVHPDYEKTAADTVVLDNKGCRFAPHVQGIRV